MREFTSDTFGQALGKTLVTGAGGFIGGRLIVPGVRALVRKPRGLEDEVVGDLLDDGVLARACQGIDTIFHCAGAADALDTDEAALWRANVEATERLLAAAVRAGVRRFVFLSSVKAMADPAQECVDEDWPGEPATPYGRSKRAAERAVLEAGARHGLHVVNLRLAMVYGRGSRGNLARMAEGIRAGWFPPLPETGNRRSLVHVADVVRAARQAAVHPRAHGQTLIVADPRPYSSRELYDALRASLGLSPARWRLPAACLRAAHSCGGRLARLAERLGGSACYRPDRIEALLGFRASIGLTEGLHEMFGTA